MRVRILLATLIAVAGMVVVPTPSDAVNAAQPTLVSADPANYTPYIKDDPATPGNDRVNAVAVVGNRVIVGGNFTMAKNWQGSAPVLTRKYILAFNATTGAIDTGFVPNVDAEVLALRAAPDGTVFVGGKFKNVNGAPAVGLVKLDVTTGARIAAFNATTDGWVYTMAVQGSRLFVGGSFRKVRTAPHPYLAAVDTTTGVVDPNLNVTIGVPMTGALRVQYLDVSPSGDRLVILGNFLQANGQPRSQVAVIDLTTAPASLANWATDGYRSGVCSSNPDIYVRGVDISPDGQYFVIVTTGAWQGTSTLCDTAARWEMYQTGQTLQPTWAEYTGGDTLTSVATTGTAVYVGGHQRWMNNSNPPGGDQIGPGAVIRNGLAALDPVNGLPYSWNPGRDRGVGVFAMVATANGLYIGHDTNLVGGEYRPRITFFPLAGGSAVPNVVEPTLPGKLYSARSDNTLVSRTYDGTTFGTPSLVDNSGWGHVRGSFTVNHDLYTGMDDGRLLKRSFDGTTFGAPVDLGSWASFSNSTGMFFTNGRLYFTLSGDDRLYYRKFEPENGLVGSQLFVVSGNGDGLSWNRTAGMTFVGGKIYVADTFRNLRSIDLVAGRPVAASRTLISGPGVDGQTWDSRGMFVQ